MNEYKVIQTGIRSLSLLRNEQPLGEMTHAKWNPSKSAIRLTSGPAYRIVPKGFWQRTTEILENDRPILSFKFRWRSTEITTVGEGIPRIYQLKIKGFWKGVYELFDESGQPLLTIEPKFRWKKFKSEFLITPSLMFEKAPQKELIMLVCVNCIQVQQRMAVAAAT